jgi:hypothetical protein
MQTLRIAGVLLAERILQKGSCARRSVCERDAPARARKKFAAWAVEHPKRPEWL